MGDALDFVFEDADDDSPDLQTSTNRGIPANLQRDSYSWAQDCFWVFDNLGGRMTRQSAGSASRWALWNYAKKEMDKFIGQIMPKAMGLLEKSLDKAGDANIVVVKEQKNIAELKSILAAALIEAGR